MTEKMKEEVRCGWLQWPFRGQKDTVLEKPHSSWTGTQLVSCPHQRDWTGEAKPKCPALTPVINPNCPAGRAKRAQGQQRKGLFLSFSHLTKLEPSTVCGQILAGVPRKSTENFQQVQAKFLYRTNQSISTKSNRELTNLHLNQL